MMRQNDLGPRAESRLIQPYDMEVKDHYVARFAAHRDMKETFTESYQCREIAEQIWRDRMEDATVTVRFLNGDEYFIR